MSEGNRFVDSLPHISGLPQPLGAVVAEVAPRLVGIDGARCLIWGGSSASEPLRVGADVDLWLVVDDPNAASAEIRRIVNDLPQATYVHSAGYFPWFGELTTVFLSVDGSLSLDMGTCSPAGVGLANPGPHARVVWGETEFIIGVAKNIKDTAPDARLAHLTITLVKLRKAVRRRHLWNALSYLAQARNDLIGIERTLVAQSGVKYSRPEHSAEDWLDRSLQHELVSTHAAYDAADILRGASALCELARRIGYACSEPKQFWGVLDGIADGLIADQLSVEQAQ